MGGRGSSGVRGRLGAIAERQATRQKVRLTQCREWQVADPLPGCPLTYPTLAQGFAYAAPKHWGQYPICRLLWAC